MRKRTAIIVALGVLMFGTFLKTAKMHFSANPAHPRLVYWLMAGSAFGSVLCGFTWLYFYLDSRIQDGSHPRGSKPN